MKGAIEMSLIDKIKDLCASREITLVGLERELGFSRGSIFKWDKNFPSIDKVTKVAEYFDVSIDYLLGKTEFKNPSKGLESLKGKDGLYFRFAEKAKEMDLSEKDVDFILDIVKKYKG